MGVLLSSLIVSSIIGILLIYYTFHDTGLHFSRTLARSMLVYSAPLIFSYIGEFILTYSDRYFLKAFGGLSEVGVYSLGCKLGFVLWVFSVKPIFNIWEPQRFEIAQREDALQTNYRVFFFSNILIITLALIITLFSYDLFRVMSAPEFWEAYKVVPVIMLVYIVQAWTSFGNFGLYYSGDTKRIALSTMGGAVAAIVFSFLLIPSLKSYGAALATLMAFLVRFLLIYPKAQSYYKLNLPWRKCMLILATASIAYIVSQQMIIDNVILSISVRVLIVLMFILFLFLLPIFDKKEKTAIYDLMIHPKGILNVFKG